MEKHEQEPQWYDTARRGPFRDRKFTEAAESRVIRQTHPDGSGGLDQTLPAARRRRSIRTRIFSAAVILLLLGAGALYLRLDGTGQSAGFNPSKAASAGITRPAVAGQEELTDDGLIEAAQQTVQEQLGKIMPILFVERLKGPEEGIAAVHFKEGEDSATVLINIKTGEVINTNMNMMFTPEEVDPEFIQEAIEHLREAGYQGEFTVTGLKHFVHYGLNKNEQGIQSNDGLMADEGQIDYENGVYRSSTFRISEEEAGAKVTEAGLRAIKLLRAQETDHTDQLYSIKHTVAPEWDILVLTYGEDEFGAATVMMDYASQDIIQVTDNSLQIAQSSDSAIRGEQDTKLLNMDKAKLQTSAAAIANELFGIRLEDYTVDQRTIGTITFKSPDGVTLITGLFNLNGDFYMIQQTPAPAE